MSDRNNTYVSEEINPFEVLQCITIQRLYYPRNHPSVKALKDLLLETTEFHLRSLNEFVVDPIGPLSDVEEDELQ